MSRGILPSLFGGSTLSAIDNALGIPTKTVMVQQPASPAQGGLMGLGLPATTYHPQPGVVQSPNNSPFAELVIPFDSLNSPLAPSYNPTFTNLPPYLINIPGEALVYKQSGSPPSARITVDLGGRLYVMQPGSRLVAPFQNFSIVKRNFLITKDLNNATALPTPVSGFSGEAHLVIEKQANISFREASNDAIRPWFRPCILIGQILGNNNLTPPSTLNAFVGINAGTPLYFASSGCQKLRLYADGNTTFNPQAGDSVSFHLAEVIQSYELDYAYYNYSTAPLLVAESLSGNLKYETPTVVWPGVAGTENVLMFDFDVSDCLGGFMLFFKTSAASPSAKVILLGVP